MERMKNMGKWQSLVGKGGGNFNRCAKCNRATYCNRKCETDDWPHHKKECGKDSVYTMACNSDEERELAKVVEMAAMYEYTGEVDT